MSYWLGFLCFVRFSYWYILGHFCLACYKTKFEILSYDLFAKLLAGTFLLITLYSIWKSQGITFSVIYVFLGAVILWTRFQEKSYDDTSIISFLKDFRILRNYRLLGYLGAILGIFVLRCIWLMDTETGLLFSETYNADNDYYGQLSDFMKLTGQENRYLSLNLWDERAHGITPYHYFELWMTAILSDTFPIATMYVYMIFTFCCFMFILLLGYEALITSITQKIHLYYLVLAFIFCFHVSFISTFFLVIPAQW